VNKEIEYKVFSINKGSASNAPSYLSLEHEISRMFLRRATPSDPPADFQRIKNKITNNLSGILSQSPTDGEIDNAKQKIKKIIQGEVNAFSIKNLFFKFMSLHDLIKNTTEKHRIILAPEAALKKKQSVVAEKLSIFSTHYSCFGFCKNKSAFDCANIHITSHINKPELLVNLDIKNFFCSFKERDIVKSLTAHKLNKEEVSDIIDTCTIKLNKTNCIYLLLNCLKSFINKNLLYDNMREAQIRTLNVDRFLIVPFYPTPENNKKDRLLFNIFWESFIQEIIMKCLKLGIIEDSALLDLIKPLINIGQDVEFGERFLPQGSPASPSITNLSFKILDYRLSGLAKKNNCVYSRYADDLSFTWEERYGQKYINLFIYSVKNILKSGGFYLNNKKTKIIGTGGKMDIVGYVINSGKPTISNDYIQLVRTEIMKLKGDVSNRLITNKIIFDKKVQKIKGKINYIFSGSPNKTEKLNKLISEINVPGVVNNRTLNIDQVKQREIKINATTNIPRRFNYI